MQIPEEIQIKHKRKCGFSFLRDQLDQVVANFEEIN